jgi:uncharacterized protein YcnI
MKLRQTIVATLAVGLVVAPTAAAHVAVNPSRVAAGSLTRFDFLIPNEMKVPTVKVSIQLPAGLEEVTFQPKAGWKRSVKEAQGRTVVTWSGGQIGPEEFDVFALSAEVPDTPGKDLAFPTLQTYANGNVVRWIEAPSSELPAPRVALEAADETSTTTSTLTSTSGDGGDDHDELAIGLAVAGLAAGLLALGLTLVRRRRA